MQDKVFLKTKKDGLWETNPRLVYSLYLLAGLILFFGCIIIGNFSVMSVLIGVVLVILISDVLVVKHNNDYNISKSIGFIKRGNKWYAIKLMYYVNGGRLIRRAIEVQNKEKEIQERRVQEEEYSKILDKILNKLENEGLSEFRWGSIDGKIDKRLNGYYFHETIVDSQPVGIIYLRDARLDARDKKHIYISYATGEGISSKREQLKFRNVYDGLIEEMTRVEGV